jgi:GDPmannose 4,6-dehydratase
MSIKVLITGILGQDGANMTEYLLSATDHHIYGMQRRSGTPNYDNIKSFRGHERFTLVDGDLADSSSINDLVIKIEPDYFINFGANSYVGVSWDTPLSVFDSNTSGVIRCLEAIRKHKPDCRFYSAGSSEEFGDVDYSPQDINHPIKPRSPYGASKAAARHIVKVYKESYDLYAVHSILFNHEGPRRGAEFVTRKITQKVAEIYHKIQKNEKFEPLKLGNIESKRDWSDSRDFMRAVWLMLNQDEPKDYVLASGKIHSVREFVSIAFQNAGVPGLWSGEGLEAKFRMFQDNTVLAEVDERWFRPAEVDLLHGDPSVAEKELGWKREISFDKMVKDMVESDLAIYAKKEKED